MKTITICLLILFVLCGCKGNELTVPSPRPEIKAEQTTVSDAAKEVGSASISISDRANKIDQHAIAIESNAPIQPEVDGIKNETEGLRETSTTLSDTEAKLKEAVAGLSVQQKNIEKQSVQLVKLQDKIKELESSNSKMLKTMLSWVIVCCVIGIGASLVIGFFFKTPGAFMVAAGCVATMGVAVSVTFYLQQIAWVSLALLAVGFLVAIFYVFMQIKNRDIAVKELVHTGEIAKTYLPTTVREKIFGNAVEPGVANQVQSDTTIKLVRNVRHLDKDKRGYGLAPELPKTVQNVQTILG